VRIFPWGELKEDMGRLEEICVKKRSGGGILSLLVRSGINIDCVKETKLGTVGEGTRSLQKNGFHLTHPALGPTSERWKKRNSHLQGSLSQALAKQQKNALIERDTQQLRGERRDISKCRRFGLERERSRAQYGGRGEGKGFQGKPWLQGVVEKGMTQRGIRVGTKKDGVNTGLGAKCEGDKKKTQTNPQLSTPRTAKSQKMS